MTCLLIKYHCGPLIGPDTVLKFVIKLNPIPLRVFVHCFAHSRHPMPQKSLLQSLWLFSGGVSSFEHISAGLLEGLSSSCIWLSISIEQPLDMSKLLYGISNSGFRQASLSGWNYKIVT